MKKLVSVVIPCYNEEAVVDKLLSRLNEALVDNDLITYELILVDDGSTDSTVDQFLKNSSFTSRYALISLSRNFGHQAAVTAGIDYSKGDAIIVIDADLQDPPELIPQMIKLWLEGAEVVYGRRVKREGESFFKKSTASLFYRLLNRYSEVPIPLDSGDFRLFDKCVADVLRSMPESDRFIRGLVSWAGFRQAEFRYIREERAAGVTKYPLAKMIRFASDALLSFSLAPLRFAMSLGIGCALIAVLGIFYIIAVRLATNDWVSGWATIMVAVLFLGGIQLLCIGVLGEYIGRTYRQVKQRPLYVTRKVYEPTTQFQKLSSEGEG